MFVLPHSSALRTKTVEQVTVADLNNFNVHAQDVMAVAMKLTDSWGQAMFILNQNLVQNLFTALGFSAEVAANVFESVRALGYVHHRIAGESTRTEFTWHVADAACMTLRGIVGMRSAFNGIDDSNVEQFLLGNRDLFDRLMGAMPEYAANLMFSPGIGATVIETLGGAVSAEKLYEMAWTYGGQVTKDLDGRLGVSTQFVRALTLTISARI
jgi:hypothetical protein